MIVLTQRLDINEGRVNIQAPREENSPSDFVKHSWEQHRQQL